MGYNGRKSGIGVIGDIPWGTHIAQLYSCDQEFFEISIPFIHSGLKNNELCLWIYADNVSFEETIIRFEQHGTDVRPFVDSGQLIIIPYNEWYIGENGFDEERVHAKWKALVGHALSSGYDGLRATGDTSWLERGLYRSFLQYEHNINVFFSGMSFLALCMYNVNKINPVETANIVKNHNYIISWFEGKPELIRNMELLIKDRQLKESRELLEHAVEFEKMKTEFLSNITHELKTPISVISSAAQVLLKTKSRYSGLCPVVIKYLKTILKNSYRLLRLVNNLLDITRINSNFFDIRMVNYKIVDLIESITLSVNDYAKSRGITVAFESNTRDMIIACDPEQIMRIMLNLLSNSIKNMPQGGNIQVTLLGSDINLKIIVKDTGIGIPAEKQSIIFERFYQVDASLRRPCEGSGIGLSIVKALVEKHNGKVAVRSEPGKGSEFTIELPNRLVCEQTFHRACWCETANYHIDEKIRIEFSDIYQ